MKFEKQSPKFNNNGMRPKMQSPKAQQFIPGVKKDKKNNNAIESTSHLKQTSIDLKEKDKTKQWLQSSTEPSTNQQSPKNHVKEAPSKVSKNPPKTDNNIKKGAVGDSTLKKTAAIRRKFKSPTLGYQSTKSIPPSQQAQKVDEHQQPLQSAQCSQVQTSSMQACQNCVKWLQKQQCYLSRIQSFSAEIVRLESALQNQEEEKKRKLRNRISSYNEEGDQIKKLKETQAKYNAIMEKNINDTNKFTIQHALQFQQKTVETHSVAIDAKQVVQKEQIAKKNQKGKQQTQLQNINYQIEEKNTQTEEKYTQFGAKQTKIEEKDKSIKQKFEEKVTNAGIDDTKIAKSEQKLDPQKIEQQNQCILEQIDKNHINKQTNNTFIVSSKQIQKYYQRLISEYQQMIVQQRQQIIELMKRNESLEANRHSFQFEVCTNTNISQIKSAMQIIAYKKEYMILLKKIQSRQKECCSHQLIIQRLKLDAELKNSKPNCQNYLVNQPNDTQVEELKLEIAKLKHSIYQKDQSIKKLLVNKIGPKFVK